MICFFIKAQTQEQSILAPLFPTGLRSACWPKLRPDSIHVKIDQRRNHWNPQRGTKSFGETLYKSSMTETYTRQCCILENISIYLYRKIHHSEISRQTVRTSRNIIPYGTFWSSVVSARWIVAWIFADRWGCSLNTSRTWWGKAAPPPAPALVGARESKALGRTEKQNKTKQVPRWHVQGVTFRVPLHPPIQGLT